MKPTVVVTHRVHDEILELLSTRCTVIANQSDDTLPRSEILRRAANADALMAFMPDMIDADFVDACPRLKIIGGALKGYDNFDVAACSSRGIWFSNVPDLLTVPTAELAIGLMIGLIRHVRSADAELRQGGFRGWRPRHYGLGIEGSTIAIVGMGAIGQAIAQRLQGWGARLRYTDSRRLTLAAEVRFDLDYRPLDALLTDADIVMLALPLTDATLHTFDTLRLAQMRTDAWLINPCRGSVVDESAVLAALQSGRLAGYAADVFEMEDWARPDRPRHIDPRLLDHPRTLLTPHLGSAVASVRLAIERCAAENILAVFAGQRPPQAVNEPMAIRETRC